MQELLDELSLTALRLMRRWRVRVMERDIHRARRTGDARLINAAYTRYMEAEL